MMEENAPKRAVEALVRINPPPDRVIAAAVLYRLGGFPQRPERGTAQEFQAWTLDALRYREAVRHGLLERLGRLLYTQRNGTYVLLSPADTVAKSEEDYFDKVQRESEKALFRIGSAAVTNREERSAQMMARMRVGAARAGARAARDSEIKLAEVLDNPFGEERKFVRPPAKHQD